MLTKCHTSLRGSVRSEVLLFKINRLLSRVELMEGFRTDDAAGVRTGPVLHPRLQFLRFCSISKCCFYFYKEPESSRAENDMKFIKLALRFTKAKLAASS